MNPITYIKNVSRGVRIKDELKSTRDDASVIHFCLSTSHECLSKTLFLWILFRSGDTYDDKNKNSLSISFFFALKSV